MRQDPIGCRGDWLALLERLARPVLAAAARRRLRAAMPIEVGPRGSRDERARFTRLEAVARLLCGAAPFLDLRDASPAEAALRDELATLARETLDAITDPASPDYANFAEPGQPLVDAAFLAQAILRAPDALWARLPERVRRQTLDALALTRATLPGWNNWLLFAAEVEALFAFVGSPFDPVRIDYALRQHEQWYRGDGVYGDGPRFHWDYYNAFVIHPMLLDVLDVAGRHAPRWSEMAPRALQRAQRYAVALERLIGPDGALPPIGRSLTYRFGCLQPLGQLALGHRLPAELPPAQVRCAMSAAIARLSEAPGAFDEAGWLRIGWCGHQPSLAEPYISTGSLYLCAAGLLPLGLPADDPFWSGPPVAWTSARAYAGEDLPPDRALD